MNLPLHARQHDVAEYLCDEGVLPDAAEEYAAECRTPDEWRWPMPGGSLVEMAKYGVEPRYAAIAHRLVSKSQFGVQGEQWVIRLHRAGVPIGHLEYGHARGISLQNIVDGWSHDIPLELIQELADE